MNKIDYYEKNARSDLSVGGICIDDNVSRIHEVLGKENEIIYQYGGRSQHY